MASMRSPADPLFMLHHANVDRMWALWQDIHGHDLVSEAAAGPAQ
jgi:tyrosinase